MTRIRVISSIAVKKTANLFVKTVVSIVFLPLVCFFAQ